jgi:pimeloyl-ACP methyl ester carboxylesterase
MARFVLIHGAMHGGWCWERVAPLLTRHGHQVTAPDLPGMGADGISPEAVTLEGWSRFTADLLHAQPGKSILVGHSFGGMVISEAAESAPDRIVTLVYLSALLPRNGSSAFGLTRRQEVPDGKARMELHPSQDGATITAEPAEARAFLYGETPDAWAERAVSRLVPQPLAPLTTPACLSDAKFGRVPRAYVECLRDRILPLSLQRAMHEASPCGTVLAIDTDHSPFYSAPEATAAHLLRIATRFG